MDYTLVPRQKRLFRDRATIFALLNNSGSGEQYAKVYEHVPFLFAPTTNFDAPNGGIQPNTQNLLTSDVGSFHSSQEISGKWVVYIESDSAHSPDSWHKVLGGARTLPILAKSRQVYLGSMLPLKPSQIIGVDDPI